MDFNWKSLLAAGASTLGTLVGGPLGPVIGSAVGAILGVDSKDDTAMTQALVNATPEQKAALIKLDQDYKLEMERLRQADQKMQLDAAQAGDANQTQLLLADANSNDKFRSWGRPAAVWVCVAGLAIQCLLYPLIQWACAAWAPEVKLPAPDMGLLLFNLSGLLGLGGYRTLEKIKGAK